MDSFAVLGVIGWVLIFGLIAYVLYIGSQRAQGRAVRYSITLIILLIAGGIAFNTAGNGLVFILPQERAIVISALSPVGYRGPVLSPGLHFIVPFVESVKRYTVAQQTYTMSKTPTEGTVKGDDSVSTRTADGQLVYIDATVQYQVDEDLVTNLYIKWQDRYTDDFVRPQSRALIYNQAALYKVEEVYSTKRVELQALITAQLKEIFQRDGLKLTAFLLRNVTFSDEYAASIEQKQIAQQNAEKAKFLVELEQQDAERVRVQAKGAADATITRAQGDAESQVIKAKAESESLGLIASALKDNPNLLTYRYIEKLAPTIQTVFLPSNQPFLLDPKAFTAQPTVGPIVPTVTPPVIAPTTPITK